MTAAAESGFELLHLVARAADGARPLAARRACADLWSRLVAHFDVIACTLMPDHVHLFARVAPERALRTFAQILSAFRARAIRDRGYGVDAFEWEPLPAPGRVRRDSRHIARTIRYIHLNPCRDALCDDPFEWEWSTHRDWTGAVASSCVDVRRWGRVLGRAPSAVESWLHEYACADPSVKRYRPLADPRRYLAVSPPDASLSMLADSVTRALRSPRSAPATFELAERRLYLLSAAKWTRYRAIELARAIGSHPASVRRFLQGVRGATQVENGAGATASSRFRMSGEEARAIALTIADERLRWNGLSSTLR